MNGDNTRYQLYGFLLVAALLAAWELSARTGLVVSANWPPVSAVFAALGTEMVRGDLAVAVGATVWRMSVGYVCGVTAGVIAGIVMGTNPILRRTLEPLLEFLRPIPAPAIIPPLILFLGVDDAMKIAIIAMTAFFPVAINTLQGVVSIEPTYLAVARTFRRPLWARMRSVEFPAILPFIFAGMRISLALALVVTIVSEMIAGASGLGYYLVIMQYAVRAAEMYAAIFVIAILGYLLNAIFIFTERKTIFWYSGTD
jgi:NitT/TauT family transport system permease protein/sulfonate transport system permease protein